MDTFDQYLQISSIQRRTLKWYKKIFLFGVESSIINAKIIFELKTGKPITTVKFKENLVEQIFKLYADKKTFTRNNIYKPMVDYHCIRNTETEDNCKQCGQPTTYYCSDCGVHMHTECFVQYHNYK